MSCCGMHIKSPKFPLLCNIYAGAIPPVGVLRNSAKCQLQWTGLDMNGSTMPVGFYSTAVRQLWMPAFTDIRPAQMAMFPDIVEVPAGSLRFYQVIDVDDIAKGFPNEFRMALIAMIPFIWPIPIP